MMKTCGKNYGPLPAMCRRPNGHKDDCGQAIDDGEQVFAALADACWRVRELAKKERLGEQWPGELLTMILRTEDPTP